MRWRLPIVAAIQIETTLLYRHDLGMYLRDDMIKVCHVDSEHIRTVMATLYDRCAR